MQYFIYQINNNIKKEYYISNEELKDCKLIGSLEANELPIKRCDQSTILTLLAENLTHEEEKGASDLIKLIKIGDPVNSRFD